MKPYASEYHLKKKDQHNFKESSKDKLILNLKFIHYIFDTINFSLLFLILVLSFLSFNSQRNWSNIYLNLSKTRAKNSNLIDLISKTEEFYISELESLNTFKKTTPNDLIYLQKVEHEKENYFNKKIINIMNGFQESRYQIGY